VAKSLFLPLPFWFVIPSVASESASSRFCQRHCNRWLDQAMLVLPTGILGDTTKEREEADSLAALGMTSQKSKGGCICTGES
jgi:hypothetical protein